MGRPRIFETVEELDAAIYEYFNPQGTVDVQTKAGVEQVPTEKRNYIEKPTITGLALALGFADKTTLYEYRDRKEFSYSIKRAITMIEMYHEEGLSEGNVAGRIFALKNMGWRDKTEVEQSGGLNIAWNEKKTYETKAHNLSDGE